METGTGNEAETPKTSHRKNIISLIVFATWLMVLALVGKALWGIVTGDKLTASIYVLVVIIVFIGTGLILKIDAMARAIRAYTEFLESTEDDIVYGPMPPPMDDTPRC